MMLGLLGEELTLCFLVWLLTCAFNEASTAMVSAKLASSPLSPMLDTM